MKIGLRIWKTSLAVVLTILISQLYIKIDPLIAAIAAIISLQPSVAESLKRGGERIQATFVGASVGITFGFLGINIIGVNWIYPLLIGVGVVLAIFICLKSNIHDTAFGAISVVATMTGVTTTIFASGGYRLLSTLLGIAVATLVNFIFVPPQYRPKLLEELESINLEAVEIYKSTVEGFIKCEKSKLQETNKQIEVLKERIEDTKQVLSFYKDEFGYRRYLQKDIKSSIAKEVLIFEKAIKTQELILDRISDIAQTTDERLIRTKNAAKVNAEYGVLLKNIRLMAHATTEIQKHLFKLLEAPDKLQSEIVSSNLRIIGNLKSKLHQELNQWHLQHQGANNILSLMEISIVAYDIEQTAEYLKRLAKKLK